VTYFLKQKVKRKSTPL